MLHYGPLCSIRTWPTDSFIRIYDCSIRVSRSFNFSWQGTAKIWRAKPYTNEKQTWRLKALLKFRGMLLYNMPITPALCPKLAYYASIMLDALACLLCLKLCRHNRRRPSSEDTAMFKVILPIKRGVVIFRMFAAEREFGTHPKLFLGVILP